MYAIRRGFTGELLGVVCNSIGDDEDYTFVSGGANVWVVTDRTIAERAISGASRNYGRCYECPDNLYVGKDEYFEIVELFVKE